MNLDLSPDGRTIAFDLLGDIYTVPISGGHASRIASGLAYEVQPRFSPSGEFIAFTSDRGGGDNIWIMRPDGSDKRQVTHEDYQLLNNPTWSPDGRFIAARKHITTDRSLGTGEIWLYHLAGGTGVPLLERPNPKYQKELGEPIFDRHRDLIYFTRSTTPGDRFEYAQDSNGQLFDIEELDLKKQERSTIVSGAGGSVRPTPSPDGRMIAFVRRERARSKLYVKDLVSGDERKIYDHLDQDMQETWGVAGLYPNMAWTPDSRYLLFWSGGKIRRISADGADEAIIPFEVNDSRILIDPPRPHSNAFEDEVTSKMPRFAVLSPQGDTVAFEAFGRIYLSSGNGPARPLTKLSDEFQLHPSWSPDGRSIVFVAWNDERLGSIKRASVRGGSSTTLTRIPGHYGHPRFSPDGRTLVFEKNGGTFLTSNRWSEEQGLYVMDAKGGAPRRFSTEGTNPQFGAENDRVFFQVTEDEKEKLVSTNVEGDDRRVHFEGDLVTEYSVSPDSASVVYRESYNLFLVPLFPTSKPVDLSDKEKPLPCMRVTEEGGTYPSWSRTGKLGWSLGATYAEAVPTLSEDAGRKCNLTLGHSATRELSAHMRADKPIGTVALVGGKIVSMGDATGGIIDDGVIVVQGNRILAIGPRQAIIIPAEAKRVDVTGKTIMPGLIDAHAHEIEADGDVIPQQNWDSMAHLAFGVTTVHNPSSFAARIFPAAELQRAGLILAPRTFSSGEAVYGAKLPDRYARVDSYKDALGHVRRLKAQGAYSIKNYNYPRREQRQQVIAAARAENIRVVTEGASLFGLDVTLIEDGNTSLEHNFPQSQFYEDLLSFYSQSHVANTPTLGVTYGGLGAKAYWISHDEVFRHPLLTRHVPPQVLNPSLVRVLKAPEDDFVDAANARSAKALADRGVLVSIGGHGEQQGLGDHWELWSFVRGGMTPLEALRAGTVVPAEALGLDDVGSLVPGKLADLVILDADPLVDIRNSDKISKVMLNGRLYDAATLNEEVTGTRRRRPYYWER